MSVVPAGSQDGIDTLDRAQYLNLAATCRSTRALGPGLRAAVWVQGCAFHCPGCIAPDWIPIRPARYILVETLAEELLAGPDIEGLTISGGEPMLQAASLARLVRLMKSRRDVNVICFTGFRIEQLHHAPPGPGVHDFLQEIDVLIDGPYIQRLNDNAGLRGSRNQRVIHLTDRLVHFDFENAPRKAEVHITSGQAMLVGVPPAGMREAFQRSLDEISSGGLGVLQYERV